MKNSEIEKKTESGGVQILCVILDGAWYFAPRLFTFRGVI